MIPTSVWICKHAIKQLELLFARVKWDFFSRHLTKSYPHFNNTHTHTHDTHTWCFSITTKYRKHGSGFMRCSLHSTFSSGHWWFLHSSIQNAPMSFRLHLIFAMRHGIPKADHRSVEKTIVPRGGKLHEFTCTGCFKVTFLGRLSDLSVPFKG